MYKRQDDPVSFVEYAYSVKITQPNVPETFQKAMKLLDSELWRAAAKKEMDSLEDLQVYKLVPRCTVPPGTRVYISRWYSKSRMTTRTRRAWWLEAGAKSQEKTAATPTLLFTDFRAFEWCWLSPQRWTGKWYS